MTIEDIIQQRINESNNLSELASILKKLITYHSIDENGKLYSIRALVGSVGGLKIEIYFNEHPPPHFHVKSSGINATFSIKDFQLIEGNIQGRELKMIKWWYERSRPKLISSWNNHRPSDCKVGPILE